MEYRRLPRSGCDLFPPSGIGTLWPRTDAAQRKRAAIGQLLLPASSPAIPSFPPLVYIFDGVIAHNDSECDKTFQLPSTKLIAKTPYFTMKHCAHWNGPFEGWSEDPEKSGARNRRDLHRHTAQVATKRD